MYRADLSPEKFSSGFNGGLPALTTTNVVAILRGTIQAFNPSGSNAQCRVALIASSEAREHCSSTEVNLSQSPSTNGYFPREEALLFCHIAPQQENNFLAPRSPHRKAFLLHEPTCLWDFLSEFSSLGKQDEGRDLRHPITPRFLAFDPFSCRQTLSLSLSRMSV